MQAAPCPSGDSGSHTPHNQRCHPQGAQAAAPFGTVQALGYEYLAGRKASGVLKAYVSDMAIVLLKDNIGSVTGTLGVAYDRAGYTGQIDLAGYPGQTVSFVSNFVSLLFAARLLAVNFLWRALLVLAA